MKFRILIEQRWSSDRPTFVGRPLVPWLRRLQPDR
jgi:hypothetical protein